MSDEYALGLESYIDDKYREVFEAKDYLGRRDETIKEINSLDMSIDKAEKKAKSFSNRFAIMLISCVVAVASYYCIRTYVWSAALSANPLLNNLADWSHATIVGAVVAALALLVRRITTRRHLRRLSDDRRVAKRDLAEIETELKTLAEELGFESDDSN